MDALSVSPVLNTLPPESIRNAFDAETFREQAHRLVDQLSNYLSKVIDQRQGPIYPYIDPREQRQRWQLTPGATSPDQLADLMAEVVTGSTHLHHPRNMGHQVSAPLPAAALGDWVADLLNNGTGVYEMGPVSTLMEMHVIRWFSDHVGYGPQADGFLTSGGSLGNLTAMLAARQVMCQRLFGVDYWEAGAHALPPLTVLAGEHVHYSLQRTIQMMGWGEAGITPVAVDAHYRLDPSDLQAAYQRAEAAGRKVVAVMANACCTPTGTYDPLDPIADFCEANNLWFHVDGAHGAAAMLSNHYQDRVAGMHRADSLVIDPHKLMMMPALVTAVLFKNGADQYETFSQKASYLFASDDPEASDFEQYNLAHRTFECTKRMMAVKLYAALACYGEQLFTDYIERTFGLATAFADRILQRKGFELPVPPESNIVCFRWVPDGDSLSPEKLDALQGAIRQAIIREGDFYFVQTQLKTGLHLRTTLMNPFTTETDLDALLDAIEATGLRLMGSLN